MWFTARVDAREIGSIPSCKADDKSTPYPAGLGSRGCDAGEKPTSRSVSVDPEFTSSLTQDTIGSLLFLGPFFLPRLRSFHTTSFVVVTVNVVAILLPSIPRPSAKSRRGEERGRVERRIRPKKYRNSFVRSRPAAVPLCPRGITRSRRRLAKA
ncbi:hypothetical protein GGS23DRAFT_176211 [Durotheca rogersii]|uniref:uncharacterized protein n=1 Tax=Durotheca rogersii TaxID=419775 RepID=UPI0022208DAF|nr:uncharacterized protein GGS23DRAFT_176211 [Durotheca rogersii]KAI5867400.1 hypothetical protein GGS23DRAFT_176211 [Durotheca rogersii]